MKYSQPYRRSGIMAIDPRAFMEVFSIPDARENAALGNVEVVDIRGPLHQHDDGWCDSYEAIQQRVQAACDGPAAIVVMRIDSPGGEAGGCFDAARAIRDSARAANKTLVAFVEGKACSASYALAAAADAIVLSQSGIVGSIGIISSRTDLSGMNAARGVRVALVTSGARKADGNPDQPITDAELKATQQIVDSMASVFFELVAELRGTDAASIANLQAGVFHGADAIAAGLADRMQSFEEMLAAFASGGSTPMASSLYDKARAALEEGAKGNDANAAAMKRALAAMEEKEPEKAEGDGDGDHKEPDGDEPKKAEGGGDAEPDDEDKDKKKPAEENAKAANETALKALAEVHKLKAERAVEKLELERRELLASRPDFSAEMLALLATSDMGTVRKFVKALPKVEDAAAVSGDKPRKVAPPVTTVAATRGAPAGELPLSAATEMDRAMGFLESKLTCTRQGNALVFGITEVPRVAPGSTPVAGGTK